MSKIGKSTKSSNGKFILKIISYIYIPSFYNLSKKKKKENLNNNRAFIKKKFVKILKRSYDFNKKISIKKNYSTRDFYKFSSNKNLSLKCIYDIPFFSSKKNKLQTFA